MAEAQGVSSCPFARILGLSAGQGKCPVAHSREASSGCSKDTDSSLTECREDESSTKNEISIQLDDAKQQPGSDAVATTDVNSTGTTKCPLGYDSASFKIGPLSCVICKALLCDCVQSVPCQHIFCRGCLKMFKDCPLCGADVESMNANTDLQALVDRFIQGHARYQRVDSGSPSGSNRLAGIAGMVKSYQDDVNAVGGGFLLQQAMRAFAAQNFESAKERLLMCVEDAKLEREDLSQDAQAACRLGAVLGSLGDCWRAMGQTEEAERSYEESAGVLSEVPEKDEEVVHAIAVSWNKLGDLRYYSQDLEGARSFYARALSEREAALASAGDDGPSPSQVLDVAVSLVKVADVDRSIGDVGAAEKGFRRALERVEGLALQAEDPILEKKHTQLLEFIKNQLQ